MSRCDHRPRASAASRRLVAFDLDGTALLPDGTLAPGVADVLLCARQRDVSLASVSGRNVDRSLYPFAAHLNISSSMYIGAYNGAVVLSPEQEGQRQVLLEQRLPEDALAPLLDELRSKDHNFIYYKLDCGVDGRITERVIPNWPSLSTDAIQRQTGTSMVFDCTLLDQLASRKLQPPPKLLILPGKDRRDSVFQDLVGLLRGCLYIARTSDDRIEIMSPAVSKRTAVARIAQVEGLSLADVVAVGDGDNDLPMLSAAGRGFLLANAAADIREEAQGRGIEIGPLCSQGGFAEVMRREVLNNHCGSLP